MSIYNKKHSHFIEEAIKEANKSLMNKKHGCIIVHNNTIISKGFNYRIDRIKNATIQYSIHAEECALKKLIIKKNQSYNMYVVRVHDNELKISLPCKKCKKFINRIKLIKKIYYSVIN